MKFEYDHNFPIRGLYYDKSKGCLLKLDFFGSIERDGCYYGRRKVFSHSYALMSFLIYLRFTVFCLLSYAVFAIQLTRTADISLKDMCRDLV